MKTILILAGLLGGVAFGQGFDKRDWTVEKMETCRPLCLTTLKRVVGADSYEKMASYTLTRNRRSVDFTATVEGEARPQAYNCHQHGAEIDCH